MIPEKGPVSVSTVKRELGATTNSVAELCRHQRINQWSLCKPVAHATVGDITDAQRAEADYGFVLNSYAAPYELRQALLGGTAWRYAPPSGDYAGGDSARWQPCRLGDFRGYRHDAEPFLKGRQSISLNPDKTHHTFFAEYSLGTGTLSWKNMHTIADKYPCLVILRPDSSYTGGFRVHGWKSAAKKFADGGGTIDLYADGGTDGDTALAMNIDYTYLLCASIRQQLRFDGSISLGRITALPGDPALTGIVRRSNKIDYLSTTILGIVSTTPTTGNRLIFTDPSEYSGLSMIDGEPKSLDVSPDGHIAILVRIDNTDQEAHSATQLKLHASQTLSSTSEVSLNATVFAVSGALGTGKTWSAVMQSQLSEVIVPANSSVTVALYAPSLMYRTVSGGISHPPSGKKQTGVYISVLWKNCELSYGNSIAVNN